MFGVVSGAVDRLKRSWREEPYDLAIRRAWVEAGHEWREHKLGPVTTIKLFLLQIQWGNAACNQLPHFAERDVAGLGLLRGLQSHAVRRVCWHSSRRIELHRPSSQQWRLIQLRYQFDEIDSRDCLKVTFGLGSMICIFV